MDDQQSAIIKQLVDSLTTSLSQIVIKLESVHPVLNRIEEDIHLKNSIDLDRMKMFDSLFQTVKEIKHDSEKLSGILNSMGDFSKEFDKINKSLDDLKSICLKNREQVIAEGIQSSKNINEINDGLKPITKFTALISKPIGFVIFLIGVFAAMEAINKGIEFALKHLFDK